jgi:hypothetical protein
MSGSRPHGDQEWSGAGLALDSEGKQGRGALLGSTAGTRSADRLDQSEAGAQADSVASQRAGGIGSKSSHPHLKSQTNQDGPSVRNVRI